MEGMAIGHNFERGHSVKPDLLGTNFSVLYVQNRQVFGLYRLDYYRFPSLELYLKYGLYRILVYSGFFFRQVYSRFVFRQVYSGLFLDRFIQDSFLVRYIQDSLLAHLAKGHVSFCHQSNEGNL
jgi:hypothetical protein